VRIGLPVGPGDLAMVTSQPAPGPESVHRVPAPEEALVIRVPPREAPVAASTTR
jgi:hypothetical protein